MIRSPGDDGPGVTLTEARQVTEAEGSDIADLATAAEAADGVSPLDDQVRAELLFGASADSRHVLGRLVGGSGVVGYAHVSGVGKSLGGHLVVHPAERRHGVGSALVRHLLTSGSGGTETGLRLWAHGDTPGAQALAAVHGFRRVRELMQLRRDLSEALAAASYPENVTVRTFEPGRDDKAWVALNAAAFADHPEQGRLTVDDLRHRVAQPWFDAAGFFLAERDDALLGSHWTKVHPAAETGTTPVGEVYAVGVHPAAQGLGLGRALTLTGLEHLQHQGLAEVMLYVDGDNPAGLRLYERLGFATSRVDAMYAVP